MVGESTLRRNAAANLNMIGAEIQLTGKSDNLIVDICFFFVASYLLFVLSHFYGFGLCLCNNCDVDSWAGQID